MCKNDLYKKARVERNIAYDGVFYFAVKTTGIVCKPSCKSPMANEENVTYFETYEEAEHAGYRPCLRCQPDKTNEDDGVEVIQKMVDLMVTSPVDQMDLDALYKSMFLSERRIRQIFKETFDGLGLNHLILRHRLKCAVDRLMSSNVSISQIGLSVGFNSLKHFNQVFKDHLGCRPSDLRKSMDHIKLKPLTYVIHLPDQYNIKPILAFLEYRMIPGLEFLDHSSYTRTYKNQRGQGYVEVDFSGESDLVVKIYTLDISSLIDVHLRLEKMFDLKAPIEAISDYLARFEVLKSGFVENQVPRISMAFDENEFLVRAIMGQQISIKAATTLTGRIIKRCDDKCPTYYPPSLSHFFPEIKTLAVLELDGLGITKTRSETLTRTLEALERGDFTLSPQQGFEAFKRDFKKIKGIGDWTVNYVAMRGIGFKDSFPAMDLGVIRVLEKEIEGINQKKIEAFAKDWKPYRAYATYCLWERYKRGV